MNDLFLDGNIQIINCDMFDECGLPSITDCAIDAIITDFPYGTLNKRNGWDKVIDYEEFWRIVNKKKKEEESVKMCFGTKIQEGDSISTLE